MVQAWVTAGLQKCVNARTRFAEFFEKIAENFNKTMSNKEIFFIWTILLHFIDFFCGIVYP